MNKVLTFLIISFFGTAAVSQELLIESVGGKNLSFEKNKHYLNIDISQLKNEVPASTKWLARLFGKKANLIMSYIEIGQGTKVKKVPIFKYRKTKDDNYTFETIGVLKDEFTYPLVEWLPYDENNPPTVKLYVRSWSDKDETAAVEQILNGAKILGGLSATKAVEAIEIGNTIINLINTLWPPKDKNNELTLSFNEANLKKSDIALNFKSIDSEIDPIMTLKIRLTEARFIEPGFAKNVSTLGIPEIEIWRKSIQNADAQISKTGLVGIISQLDNFAQYVENLDLVFVDKVLLVAGTISEWAGNAVEGYTDEDGNKVSYKMTHYRKLPVADWTIANRYSDYLRDVVGNDYCETDPCKAMASILTKIFVLDRKDLESSLTSYVASNITLDIDGSGTRVARADFLSKLVLLNDSGFQMKPAGLDKWNFNFNNGSLKFEFDGQKYENSDVQITILKNDANYLLSSFKIIGNNS